ncbi:MAG: protein jag [Clostridia bacterium]|nr:protein jag [Clostridia bacterium]
MQKELLKEAETVEEAVKLAAEELGVPKENLLIEVLQEPQKKTFGLFGGVKAQVKVTVKEQDPSAVAIAFLKDILKNMDVEDVEVTATVEDGTCALVLEGEDLGFIIGRRGETLDALQYLTSLVVNRLDGAFCRVTVNVGNYREKREKTLSGLARKAAIQAAKTGRKTSLEPMNPYERRIIHTAVQKVTGATSFSVGSEPQRHVVIAPSDDNPVKTRSRNRRSENREGRPVRAERPDPMAIDRPVRKFVPRSNPMNTAEDIAPPERTTSETEIKATLYGRIDL